MSKNLFVTETKKKEKKKKKMFFDKLMKLPKSAQDTIPFSEVYDNGLFKVGENTYALIAAFENIDYSLLRQEEQEEKYNLYQKVLNSLPTDCSYQEFIMNSNVSSKKYESTLIPNGSRYPLVDKSYKEVMKGFINKAEIASSEKTMLIVLTYTPKTSLDNANILFKYYRELQTSMKLLDSEIKQLEPTDVFKILWEYYHPFSSTEFLLPKDIYSRGGRIKDYIAPTMLNFKPKHVEVGDNLTRILYVKHYDRELDDGFIADLLDNNFKISLSKQLQRIDKGEALEKVRKEIFNLQGKVQKRKEKNHKAGTDFIPFQYQEKLKELETLQTTLSGSNNELFEVGIFISISAKSLEELDELTVTIKSRALKHQVRIETLIRQQEKGMSTLLPFGVNHFNVGNMNNVNTYLLTDATAVLIPFSSRTFFSENGVFYGINRITQDLIVLDRTEELNANGFILGSSGSGKSMASKLEDLDIMMKGNNDEVIILDPENEYSEVLKYYGDDGEHIEISPSSKNVINLFDTSLQYSDEGRDAIGLKADFIMTIIETAKGMPLSSKEKTLIDRCCKLVYTDYLQHDGNIEYIPTLIDFYEVLLKQEEKESEDIALVLELYTKGSFKCFAGKTNVSFNKKMTVIDISKMGTQLMPVGMQVALELLWQRTEENARKGIKTWVKVDEFSILFNDIGENGTSMSGEFFNQVYKRIRKRGGSCTALTQNISEVLESKQARNMINNTEFCILLRQKPQDLKEVVNMFHLSAGQEQLLKDSPRGGGLIICGQKTIPFYKEIPVDSMVYKMCQTDPQTGKEFS